MKDLYENQSKSVSNFDAEQAFGMTEVKVARADFEKQGAVYITNTGINDKNALLPFLSDLGFGHENSFSSGGRTSSMWQEKWAAEGLRRMDHYPPHLTLLPNNEVQYQRSFPTRILFLCTKTPDTGGGTFLHAAKDVELNLSQSKLGKDLLNKIFEHGMTIQTGFLDKNHPEKQNNYFQSWQERFGTDDKDKALEIAQSTNDEYDDCWWHAQDGYETLMTRIVLDGFFLDDRNGEKYLRFPRIAMDAGIARNGFRCFPLGNGEELLEGEKTLLKEIYIKTRQGCVWKTGDIILMDNIRYGHSREPFTGSREILVGMAGIAKI